jgi:hypothetical protein
VKVTYRGPDKGGVVVYDREHDREVEFPHGQQVDEVPAALARRLAKDHPDNWDIEADKDADKPAADKKES